MSIRVTNRDFGGRQAFRPMLGASPSLSTLKNITPDSVPPEKVPQMPVSTAEANEARTAYILSAKALQGWVSEDLKNIKVADWDSTMARVVPFVINQYNMLVQKVRGRTGDSDGEYALELSWWGLWDQAYQANQSRPSSAEQAAAAIARFFSDFVQGSKTAWQDYSNWSLAHAGPVLRKYHDSLEHLALLEANLLEAAASGEASEGDLFNQEQAVGRARESVGNARSLYKTLSGGSDLDALAVQEFGPIELGGWAIPAALVPVVIAISVAIIKAAGVVASVGILTYGGYKAIERFGSGAKETADNLVKTFKDNPFGTTAAVALVLGMIALPFALFRSKEVAILPSPEKV